MHCSLDKMKITATFYPPSQGGASLNEQDILAYLKGWGYALASVRKILQIFWQIPSIAHGSWSQRAAAAPRT